MYVKSALFAAASLFAAVAAAPAYAAWHVDNDKSAFHFVTTKAGKPGTAAIQEVQTFERIGGTVADDGTVTFYVDLASVETRIPLRNIRIKNMLFNVAANPQATFSGKVDAAVLKALPAGGWKDVDLNGQLTIDGQSRPVTAQLRVVGFGHGALLVETRAPIIVNAADFGIQAGVDAMREVMGLDVLSDSAPVSFSVVLKQD